MTNEFHRVLQGGQQNKFLKYSCLCCCSKLKLLRNLKLGFVACIEKTRFDHEILSIATTKQRAKLNPHVPRTHEAPNHKIGYGSSAALERGYCFIAKTLANSIFEDMADQKGGFLLYKIKGQLILLPIFF